MATKKFDLPMTITDPHEYPPLKFEHKGVKFKLIHFLERHGDASGGVVLTGYFLLHKKAMVALPVEGQQDAFMTMLGEGKDVEYYLSGMDRGLPRKFSKAFLKYVQDACEAHIAAK